MAPTALEKYVNEREALKHTVQYLESEVTSHNTNSLTIAKVNYLLSAANDAGKDSVHVHTCIMHQNPADPNAHAAEYTSIRRNVGNIISALTGIKMALDASNQNTITSSSSSNADLRLPKLELPYFDGDLQQWISFRDLFATAVHNNQSLSKSQKFTYLKAQLRGEALRQIQSMVISDTNYDTAWAQLATRYHNERELLFCIMRRLFNQPIVIEPTATAIRQLVDTTKECLRSLEILNCPVNHYDAFITYILFTKLDSTSRELWEHGLNNSSLPDLKQLYDFLESRARALAASTNGLNPRPTKHHNVQMRNPEKSKQTKVMHTFKLYCIQCKSNKHFLHKCPDFLILTPQARFETIRKLQGCINCLRGDHTVSKCHNPKRCHRCQAEHHTLLHRDDNQSGGPTASTSNSNPQAATSTCNQQQTTKSMHAYNSDQEALLATALVSIKGQQCRSFLDSGAQANFITEDCARRLQLPKQPNKLTINGMGDNPVARSRGSTTIQITPHFNNGMSITIPAIIVPKITNYLPNTKLDITKWNHLRDIKLADPYYYMPGSIDMLLGAEVFFSILQTGKREGKPGSPTAINSSLGWLVGGGACVNNQTAVTAATTQCCELASSVQKFWELESLPNKKFYSDEEQKCIDHFTSTVQFKDKRFTVRLPLKSSSSVGDTMNQAVHRLQTMEKKLAKNEALRLEYSRFMEEYEDLSHMTEVGPPEDTTQVCYIPHHFVLKEDSTTTKLRVVFDASMKSSEGSSLNDHLMVGPTVQDTLYNIILRFRCNKIAFTADITKMYRQILVDSQDRRLQRIVWRNKPTDPIRHFELNTVTYGTASAPFLATQCLQTLADTGSQQYPLGSKTLKNDFYVDDCMSGGPTLDEAKKTRDELNELLNSAGLPLRKWASNSPELTQDLDPALCESIGTQQTIKTLGIHWDPCRDSFRYTYQVKVPNEPITKRKILSYVSKYFDPLGWISPVVLIGKLLIQELWQAGLTWDQPISAVFQTKWNYYLHSMGQIAAIRIPRWYFNLGDEDLRCHQVALVGYSDASEKAYASTVYICLYRDNKYISSSLVTSKTRLAPLKKISLPRLELCGALLLAETMKAVENAIHLPINSKSAWTDSMDVLHWIHGHPSRWKNFVANRVAKIQDLYDATHWGHIKGVDNPADIASRGIAADELQSNDLWWHGSNHLKQGLPIPKSIKTNHQNLLEVKSTIAAMATTINMDFISKYSTYRKLIRVLYFILRFYQKLGGKMSHGALCRDHSPTPCPRDLQLCEIFLVRLVQSHSFPAELKSLRDGTTVNKQSKLYKLSPFYDEELHIIRVGGRLHNANTLTEFQKHPMVIPRDNPLTTLIIRKEHYRTLHGGSQLMISSLSQRYWILRAKDAVKAVINRCVICTKERGQTMEQIMGNLPSYRVTPSRPFSKCGVDFAGPFPTRAIQPRSKITLKSYICLFVCVATRAIHLEVVSDLSTPSFLACFRRFVSRRGLPTDVYSDCGTNFVGAAKDLEEVHNFMNDPKTQDDISRRTTDDKVTWHFNPPSAPHFGGLWEAGVKSMKHHLRRLIGSQRLTFEELMTVTTQIEAVLNSRPLTSMTDDPNDLEPLTPGHFLIGSSLLSIPDVDSTTTPITRLKRWQLLQQVVQHFWNRWHNEYLVRLQIRNKWLTHRKDVKIGDLVVIKTDNVPPSHWKLGRVLKLHPGADGYVRAVTLKTCHGEIQRPIVKLCVLPVTDT